MNIAISTQEDFQLLDQLPNTTVSNIYANFLFSNFLYTYKTLFEIQKNPLRVKHSYYSWSDDQYSSFMIRILQSLEAV